jgi:CheY-like chemotaxis protein
MAGRGRGADVRLRGRRVVVADDDPGVTWFISDLLRTAGCEVYEALDGTTALDLAFRVEPELVVSDILMPNLDGFALCRALRRDIALRDTPVILLSWKEDLLQRVRELGASAAAYMRKESDSRSILARVREVLRPRARVEARLKAGGEVRGRLDGLSPRLLLELVGTLRGDARVTVRDATCLFEIEIRGGTPRKATRTASDGGYRSGERALGSLLAVGAGRFVVTSSSEPVRADLSGSLFDLLSRSVAHARGALAAITGAATMNVERIVLDEGDLDDYLMATPEPARTVVQKIAAGAAPRQMLLAGEVTPSLLEDVLSDLAMRDTVRAVEGAAGADMLTPAVNAAMAVLKSDPSARRSGPPPARSPSVPAPAPPTVRAPLPPRPLAPPRAPAPLPPEAPPPPPVPAATKKATPPPPAAPPPPPPVDDFDNDPLDWPSPDSIPAPETRHASLPTAVAEEEEEPGAAPSSLEDAVMRELSDRSPAPGTTRAGSDPPPIIEPSALKRRSSNPPEDGETEGVLPSIPPDAVVPGGGASSDEMMAAAAHSSEPLIVPARPTGPPLAEGVDKVAADAREAEGDPFKPPLAPVLPAGAAGLLRPSAEAGPAPEAPGEQTEGTAAPRARQLPQVPPAARAPAAKVAGAPKARKTSGAVWFLLGLAGLAGAAGVVFRTMSEPEATPTVVATESAGPMRPPASAGASAAPTTAAPATTAATPSGAAASTSAAPPISASGPALSAPPAAAPSSDDIPPGAEVPPGYGMISVTAPAGARVRVDGAIAGKGPSVTTVAAPGYHDVRVENAGHETKSVVEVRSGKVARVESADQP